MILAHWTYTKEEWKNFIRQTKRKKNFFSYFWKLFYSFMEKKIPEVRITPEQVWIGKDRQQFSNKEFQITKIDLRDEGLVNILSIIYKSLDRKAEQNEIKIPVPKGKLREAIEVQKRLIQGC
jgi:hypothetical protein